jgi:hypothetical protein
MRKDGNPDKMRMRKMTYLQKAAHAQRWKSQKDAHAQRWQSREDAHAQRWQSRIDAHAQDDLLTRSCACAMTAS